MGVKKIRFPQTSAIGIKPVSQGGQPPPHPRRDQLRRRSTAAARVTLVHKGNIMKFTEGAFRDWGYELVQEEFADVAVSWEECGGNPGDRILVKDAIADIFLQQVLTRPEEFDVIATLNLNGDYASDALAAQVGGIGIAPGGNINYVTGHAIFEATHGTAPKYANQDMVNPGSVILSGEMMLRYMGWNEAADRIINGMERAIGPEDRHLRLPPPDGRRDQGEDLRVRGPHDRQHGLGPQVDPDWFKTRNVPRAGTLRAKTRTDKGRSTPKSTYKRR